MDPPEASDATLGVVRFGTTPDFSGKVLKFTIELPYNNFVIHIIFQSFLLTALISTREFICSPGCPRSENYFLLQQP